MLRKKRRGFSILLALCMVVSLLPVSASAEATDATISGSYVYANGQPIVIEQSEDKTVITCQDDGTTKYLKSDGKYSTFASDAMNVSSCYIYGGTNDTSKIIDSTSVTMNSGTVAGICGGSNAFSSSGSMDKVEIANVTINGGTVTGKLYGGGFAAESGNADTGTVNLTITGGTIYEVYGTAGKADTVNMTVSGGTITTVFAAAFTNGVAQPTAVVINITGQPEFYGKFYAGTHESSTSNRAINLKCTIAGGIFNCDIYGGYVEANNGNQDIYINEDISIPSSKTFKVENITDCASVTIKEGVTITNEGTIAFSSDEITNNGTIINEYGSIMAAGSGDSGSEATFVNNGKIINVKGCTAPITKITGTGTISTVYNVNIMVIEEQDGKMPEGTPEGLGHGVAYAEDDSDYIIENLMETDIIEYAVPGGFNPENYKLSDNIVIRVGQSTVPDNGYTYDRKTGKLTIYSSVITDDLTIVPILVPKTTLTVTAPTFEEVTYGYEQPAAKAITIANTGSSIAYIESCALNKVGDVDSIDWGENNSSLKELEAGASDSTSIKIQPEAGLAAGTYKEILTITYDNGKTATAEVEFKVNKKTQLAPTPAPTPTPEPDPVVGEKSEDKYGNYEVTESKGGNVEVTYTAPASKNKTTVTIPATTKLPDGTVAKVTSIDDKAFKNNKKIKKVTIGKNVEEIGKEAFSGATKLTTVTIGKNVKSIGSKAFYGAKNLKKITIKSTKLTSSKVGKQAFKGVPAKAKVDVPNKKVKAYKKFFYKKGLNKKAKIS